MDWLYLGKVKTFSVNFVLNFLVSLEICVYFLTFNFYLLNRYEGRVLPSFRRTLEWFLLSFLLNYLYFHFSPFIFYLHVISFSRVYFLKNKLLYLKIVKNCSINVLIRSFIFISLVIVKFTSLVISRTFLILYWILITFEII